MPMGMLCRVRLGGGGNKKAHQSGQVLTKISKETKENRPEAVVV